MHCKSSYPENIVSVSLPESAEPTNANRRKCSHTVCGREINTMKRRMRKVRMQRGPVGSELEGVDSVGYKPYLTKWQGQE